MAKRLPNGCEQALHFESVDALRAWFDAHHATAAEMWLLHYKAHTGKRTITWSQSVDEALAVGWIDSVLQPLDADRYAQRFSPRKPGSIWSVVNVRKAEALIAEGRMRPAGLAAYQARTEAKTAVYSHEQAAVRFAAAQERAFKADRAAWTFFVARPPSYRKAATHWVTSAKRPETQASRLATLIAHSAAGELVPQFRPRTPPGSAAAARRGSRPPSASRSLQPQSKRDR
jgi:uncharacterized protein YdeI (YjbR/CyaY-like superfamily)